MFDMCTSSRLRLVVIFDLWHTKIHCVVRPKIFTKSKVLELFGAAHTGWAIKTGPFLKVCNSCIWWRRKVIHDMFSTSSGVRLSWTLSYLNILCSSPVEQCYTKNNNLPVIHYPCVTATTRSLSKRVRVPLTFSTLFVHVQWNDTILQITIYRSPVTSFTGVSEFMEARTTCHQVARSIWLISCFEDLCNKSCVINTFEKLIISSASVALLGPIRQSERNKSASARPRKKSGDGF